MALAISSDCRISICAKAPMLSLAFRDGADGVLTSGVDAARVAGDLPASDRAYVDEMPAALALHHLDGGVGGVEEAHHVDVEHLAPLVREAFPHLREEHYAGIVDENVHASELLLGLADQAVRLALLRDVADGREHASICASDPLHEVRKSVLSPGRDDHRRTLCRQRLGRRLADAARSARDHSDLTIEFCHANRPFLFVRGPSTRRAGSPLKSAAGRRASSRRGRRCLWRPTARAGWEAGSGPLSRRR